MTDASSADASKAEERASKAENKLVKVIADLAKAHKRIAELLKVTEADDDAETENDVLHHRRDLKPGACCPQPACPACNCSCTANTPAATDASSCCDQLEKLVASVRPHFLRGGAQTRPRRIALYRISHRVISKFGLCAISRVWPAARWRTSGALRSTV
jgi:hypothetical protein